VSWKYTTNPLCLSMYGFVQESIGAAITKTETEEMALLPISRLRKY
jgi:hypothetical protein